MLLILYTLQNIHSTWISSNVSAALVLALFHEEAKKKKSIFLETYCLPVENYKLQESIKFNTRQILNTKRPKRKKRFLFCFLISISMTLFIYIMKIAALK